jgi:hypothetical protein
MTQPLRVLFLAADPSESGWRLRFDEELREIQDAIHRGRECHQMDVRSGLAVRATDLQTLLMREMPLMVHFSGHGERGQGIQMDENGSVLTDQLVRLFAHFRDTVRVVVLNACSTLRIAEGLSPLVDYVIATGAAVDDEAAIAFSRAFYGALAFGRTVPDAFALATNELTIERFSRNARSYRLLVRPGVVPEPLHRLAHAATPAVASNTTPAPRGSQKIRIGNATTARTAFNNTAAGGAPGGDLDVDIEDLKSDEIIEFNN